MKRLLPYALFLILVLIFLWRPVFTGAALLPGDYLARMLPWSSVVHPSEAAPQWNPLQWDAIAQYYPWRVFYARSMAQGYLPLWNPHQFCGTPFLANGQSAVLYPPNLVFLIFDPITAFTVYAALHLFLAAAFTYLFLGEIGCRELGRIVGAVSFAFCAFTVRWLELSTFVGSAVWLPLVLLLIHRAVERRSVFYGMLSGAALATSVLAGHFQIAFYVVLASGLWWLWRLVQVRREEGRAYAFLKVVVPLVACVTVLGLLSAAQVIPTQELAANSHRVRAVTPEGYESFVRNAIQPYRLITAFVPDFLGNPSIGTFFLGSAADYIEYGLYIGILPLMLALIGLWRIRRQRHVGFFALLGLLAILAAVGTPINALFYYLVPGFSALGGPNRILLLYFLGIAGLAGFGADWFVSHATDLGTRWSRRMPLGLTHALLAACGILIFFNITLLVSFRFVCQNLDVGAIALRQVVSGATAPGAFLLLLAAGLVLLIVRGRSLLSPTVWSGLVVAFTVGDLFAFGINYNPTCDRSEVYPRTELTTKLKAIAGTSRIAPVNPKWSLYETPKAVLPPNAAMVYGLYDAQGYDSLFLRSYQEKMALTQGIDPSPPENGNMILVRRFTPGLRSLARFVLAAPGSYLPVTDPAGTCDGVEIREMQSAAPAVAVREPDSIPGVGIRWRRQSSVRAEYIAPTRVRVAWRGSPDAIAHVPYWTSRGCWPRQVAKGWYERTYTYEPFSFRFGLFLSLVGVSALCCVGVFRAMRERRR